MLLDSQFRLLNSLCRVSHDSHCRPGPRFSPVFRWIDNEGEWPPRWQPPATPWPHVSDVWVPQHRRAVVWCMRTSTASQLIDWGDAGTAAEADALLDDRPCSENCEGRHARIWTEPGRLNVM